MNGSGSYPPRRNSPIEFVESFNLLFGGITSMPRLARIFYAANPQPSRLAEAQSIGGVAFFAFVHS